MRLNKFNRSILFITLSILLIGLVSTILSYYHPHDTKYSQRIRHHHFLHFGTIIQISLGANQPKLSTKTIEEIEHLLKSLHYKWHPWRDGALKELNNNLTNLNWFPIDHELSQIIKLSQELYNKSLGYFNPAIGKLVAYWGFHQDNPSRNYHIDYKFNLTNYLKDLPTPNNIIIRNDNMAKNTNPNLQLDLSGFIKADAMLKIKKILLAHNIHNALINIGGDIYIMGNRETNKNWIIAVKPVNTKFNNNYIKLNLNNNETIATSGIYARSRTDKNTNKLQHHIINPYTGRPADGFYSTTVIHNNPYYADAAATVLIIANEHNYKKIAASMGIDKYLLIKSNNDQIISPEMKNRIDPKPP